MKKLNKLSLFDLESKELDQKQLKTVRGGVVCSCGCCYGGGGGGSATADNAVANIDAGKYSYNC